MTRASAGCVVAFLVGLAGVAARPPAPVAGPRVDRWEYAELHHGFSPSGKSGEFPGPIVRHPARTLIRWISPQGTVEVSGDADALNPAHLQKLQGKGLAPLKEAVDKMAWEDVAKKLKVPAAKKDAAPLPDRLRIFNHPGNDGWELVTHAAGDRETVGSASDVWVFKRKVK